MITYILNIFPIATGYHRELSIKTYWVSKNIRLLVVDEHLMRHQSSSSTSITTTRTSCTRTGSFKMSFNFYTNTVVCFQLHVPTLRYKSMLHTLLLKERISLYVSCF
jgi:hypothetical protein